MGRRLDRFLRRDSTTDIVLSPLSLYHEYTSPQGGVRVTAKDDLPELLRAFLALCPQQGLGAFIAQLIADGKTTMAGDDEAHLAVRAVLSFLRGGCRMEEGEEAGRQRRPQSSSSSASCEAHVPASEKLALFLPLTEVLVDALLDYPEALDDAIMAGHGQGGGQGWPHAAVLSSCRQLYAVHGMLADVAEALGHRARDHVEERGPCVSLRSAVYMLQLVILEGRGYLARVGDDGPVCGDCARLRVRYRWWSLHHALLACRAGLEEQSSGGRWADPEAQKSQSFSLKALLVLLMDLHDLCASTTDGEAAAEAEPTGGWVCGHGVGAAAGSSSNGKARMQAGRPLWSDFLASVDGKFSGLVREVAGAAGAQSEAVMLVRANIVQCMRVALRLCPPDTLEGDEIFAFFEPPPPPSHHGSKDPPLLQYKGLPYLVNSMVSELSVSLGHKGLPLRLVQSYLDLLDVLFARIIPPAAGKQDYEEWRAGVADGLGLVLLRTTIAQSTVVRHFLRLAMTVGPPLQSLQMSCGLSRVVLGYMQDWLKEKHADVEVITASEARRQFIEEGDELFMDSDDEEEEEEEEGGEEGERAAEATTATGVAALSELRFASEACWQAAASGLFKVWEGLLSSVLDGGADDVAPWAELLRQLARFFTVVEGGGRRAKGRIIACMLPPALKSRLVAVIARLYATVRLAATRLAAQLKSQGPLEVVTDAAAAQQPDLSSSLCVAVCYHEEGTALEGFVRAWVKAERAGKRQRDSAGLLKRFPALLFAVERVHMSMHRLTQQVGTVTQAERALVFATSALTHR